MDDNDNNILLKLLKCELKPNLSHYTFDQLTNMYVKLNNNKDNTFNVIKNILSQNTFNIVENIFNNVEAINVNNTKTNTDTDTQNKKKILIDWFDNFWTKLPLLDNVGDIVECVICLNYINKNDCTTFKCNHMTHTTCFLNYLFSNLKNNSYIDGDKGVEKIFRCPNCRFFLTDTIKKSFEQNKNTNEYEVNNEYILNNNYNNIEPEYGDEYNNLILQEYNLVANLLDNNMLNNVFRMSNNVGFNSNVIINYNDERNRTQLLSSSSLSSSDFSISSDSDEN